MKFGPVAVAQSLGGIVAHSVRRDDFVLKKGEVVAARHIDALLAAGVAEVIVAQMEPGDIGENATAQALARRVAGPGLRLEAPFTGRCNLFAAAAGVLVLEPAAIDAINAVDERVTLATLPAMRSVVEGEMVATVKIIPFAVAQAVLDRVLEVARPGTIRVAAYRPLRIGVISTLLAGLKASVIAKTLRVLEARLAPMGAKISGHAEVAHEIAALAGAVAAMAGTCDLMIIFGASAITDRRDVIPAAIVAAGGAVDYFGMPVDPGNLLLLARLADGRPVLGAPGCARSPKENGFDFVLQRLVAGVAVTGRDISQMGAGGLLMEIVSRPQSRAGSDAVGHG